jgi:hypothetical protein
MTRPTQASRVRGSSWMHRQRIVNRLKTRKNGGGFGTKFEPGASGLK